MFWLAGAWASASAAAASACLVGAMRTDVGAAGAERAAGRAELSALAIGAERLQDMKLLTCFNERIKLHLVLVGAHACSKGCLQLLT